ncbi:hypothetical protein HY994_01185 [Candidatus Micrarchaeota archaeon]|nr:hypothetical protein [Candidatus Micrarchaeota archaeon]
MNEAAISIQTRLKSQQVQGIEIRKIMRTRTILGFIQRKVQIGVEVCVPFLHEKWDNRDVPDAINGSQIPDKRLERLIADHMAASEFFYHVKRLKPGIADWIENGQKVGYKAILMQKQ